MASSISQSEALLKLKKSFTKADLLNSWVPSSTPCNGDARWIGLICFNGIVTGLRLGGFGLSGKIDVDALLEIPALRSISIVNNDFSGPIPEFNRLGALKAIYLSGNQFSGKIPSSLAQLPLLIELHLENNQFSGSIPSLDQPKLISINVSNNKLDGEIPTSLLKFNTSSFEGNAGLCGAKLGIECAEAAEQPIGPNDIYEPSTKKEESSKTMIAVIITAVAVLLSIVVVIVIRSRQKKQDFDVLAHEKRNTEEQAVEVRVSYSGSNKKEAGSIQKKGSNSSSRKGSTHGKGGGVAELVVVNDENGVFGLSDLMKAAAEVLGNGALGSAYKAVMANGVAVVVKRMKDMNALGRDGFDAQMRHLANLRHWNILTPLAYHYRKDEKLLVYEYIPRGSLLYLLHAIFFSALTMTLYSQTLASPH
uniref:Protein kinase domain-containing protein n=1 Tax=Fagus sylvatica TaxID=28930 RepID=A0A2N9F9D7_FAGSY